MQLVEKHVIERSDPRYKAIDDAAIASNNLYKSEKEEYTEEENSETR